MNNTTFLFGKGSRLDGWRVVLWDSLFVSTSLPFNLRFLLDKEFEEWMLFLRRRVTRNYDYLSACFLSWSSI